MQTSVAIKHATTTPAQALNAFSRNLSPRQQGIQVIHQLAGRLVLLRDYPASDRRAKEPLEGIPWSRYRPPLDVLISHPGRLGLVPSSIECTALDVDRGNPISLPAGWVDCPSRLPGRVHKWFQETQQFKDGQWEGAGCGGEIRHKGYLVLWGNALQKIGAAIREGRQLGLFPFPADLIRAVVQGEAEQYVPGREKRAAPVPRSLWYPGMDLEAVQEGARYVALFWHLRTWAYKQRRGLDLGDWKARVLDEGYGMNERFPGPFRGREVRAVKDTAYSVSVWAWKRLIDYGRYRTPELQARRSMLGVAARRKGTPLENDSRPWETLGISKAWFYRKYRHASTVD